MNALNEPEKSEVILPVTNGTSKKVAIEYFNYRDKDFIKCWENSLSKHEKDRPKFRDTILFAKYVYNLWDSSQSRKEYYATSFKAIKEFIRDNPYNEVANFVVLKSDMYRDTSVIGFCHFRRTWCNNIFIDYLGVHPLLIKEHVRKIKGVGTTLLYCVSMVATELESNYIWGEATQLSCGYYMNVFKLPKVTDMIYIPRKKYLLFYNDFLKKQQGGK
jgi:hypothetical protein